MSVFLTVGTTSFDALVRAADDPSLPARLQARGYSSLTLQLGRGSYLPTRLVPPGESEASHAGFTVRCACTRAMSEPLWLPSAHALHSTATSASHPT